MYGLKVVIIGAGIGGLTAAIALSQSGHEVEVYERTQELRPRGAGISLWSNGVKVLNRFGMGKEIAKIGGQMDYMQYLSTTGEVLNHVNLHPLIEQVGQRPYPVARADLQALLLNKFAGKVNLGHRCISVEEHEGKVTAKFENGHETTGDLLIAADGVRSTLRECILEREVQPTYRDYVNWNGLVKHDEALTPANTWTVYVGNHQRASMMPVGEDRLYFFFDVPLPSGTSAPPELIRSELIEHFKGWAEPVQELIKRINPQQTNRLEISDVGPVDRMVRGRVALLGDAAHATCPDLGQGGCQALEDVYMLNHFLLTTNISVEDALKRYEAAREDRTRSIVKKARNRAEVIHGKDPAQTAQWYEQLRQESPSDVTDAIAKTILAGPLQ
jgi:FAD-dependent urate hydroxylase